MVIRKAKGGGRERNQYRSKEVPCFLFHAQRHVNISILKPVYLHISLKLLQCFEDTHMSLWHNLSIK